MTDKGSLGDRIRRAREKQGLTSRAFADAAGVKWDELSRWEHNRVIPRASTLAALARAGGVRLEWLISGEGSMIERRARR